MSVNKSETDDLKINVAVSMFDGETALVGVAVAFASEVTNPNERSSGVPVAEQAHIWAGNVVGLVSTAARSVAIAPWFPPSGAV
jgi:hypothetical protein